MSAGAGPHSTDGPTSPAAAGKPRFALFIATACGLGYIPVAPGTFGSLAGLILTLLPSWVWMAVSSWELGLLRENSGATVMPVWAHYTQPFLFYQCALAVGTGAVGVWCAGRAARFWMQKDPQRVVIDEVSGQHLTLLLGCILPLALNPSRSGWINFRMGPMVLETVPNWQYLLLGLILFRVFDIWKPFPARQAESLPGGWGIMADDWVAGVYAAIGLWIARAAGL